MKKIFLIVFIFFLQKTTSQTIYKDYPLSKIIEETSCLEIINNLLITHDDSGG